MRIWILALLCVVGGVLFGARAFGEGEEPQQLPHEAIDTGLEPPPPTAEIPSHVGSAHVPGTNYDPGPESALWRYNDLSSDEKAYVDRNKTANAQGVQDSYATAARDLAQRAAAEAAEHQLGLEESGSTGVIP